MLMAHKPKIRFNEIVIELDHEHIYGYENEEATEIVEPGAFNFAESRNYIRHRLLQDEDWICTHSSPYEERFLRVGV